MAVQYKRNSPNSVFWIPPTLLHNIMFSAFGAGSTNPYDSIVEKATDEAQTGESWDLLMTIWEKVNSDGETG